MPPVDQAGSGQRWSARVEAINDRRVAAWRRVSRSISPSIVKWTASTVRFAMRIRKTVPWIARFSLGVFRDLLRSPARDFERGPLCVAVPLQWQPSIVRPSLGIWRTRLPDGDDLNESGIDPRILEVIRAICEVSLIRVVRVHLLPSAHEELGGRQHVARPTPLVRQFP
jgi:hypothetical protein